MTMAPTKKMMKQVAACAAKHRKYKKKVSRHKGNMEIVALHRYQLRKSILEQWEDKDGSRIASKSNDDDVMPPPKPSVT